MWIENQNKKKTCGLFEKNVWNFRFLSSDLNFYQSKLFIEWNKTRTLNIIKNIPFDWVEDSRWKREREKENDQIECRLNSWNVYE